MNSPDQIRYGSLELAGFEHARGLLDEFVDQLGQGRRFLAFEFESRIMCHCGPRLAWVVRAHVSGKSQVFDKTG